MRYFLPLLAAIVLAAGCGSVTEPERTAKQTNTPDDVGSHSKPDVSQAAMAKLYNGLCASFDKQTPLANVDWMCERIRLAAISGRVWPKEPCDGKYTPGMKDLGTREAYRITVYVSQCGNPWFQFEGRAHQFLLGPLGCAGYQVTPVTVLH